MPTMVASLENPLLGRELGSSPRAFPFLSVTCTGISCRAPPDSSPWTFPFLSVTCTGISCRTHSRSTLLYSSITTSGSNPITCLATSKTSALSGKHPASQQAPLCNRSRSRSSRSRSGSRSRRHWLNRRFHSRWHAWSPQVFCRSPTLGSGLYHRLHTRHGLLLNIRQRMLPPPGESLRANLNQHKKSAMQKPAGDQGGSILLSRVCLAQGLKSWGWVHSSQHRRVHSCERLS